MYIQHYKALKFCGSFGDYNSIDIYIEKPLAYIYLFFEDAYVYIRRQGITEFLQEIDENIQGYEYVYELVSLSTDYYNKLIYLHDTQFNYCKDAKTPELAQLLDKLTPLQACQQNLIEYIVLTQENFHELIHNWDKLYEDNNLAPFALLYQDNHNWYSVKPFDTEEAMQEFIAQHLQK